MHGKPIIGCDIGGMREVIRQGETGLLATPGDLASLKSNIEMLIENSELRLKLGNAARQSYLALFTAEHMASTVVCALNSLSPSESH